MRLTFLIMVLVLARSATSYGIWSVHSDGPDVFGDTTVNAINAGDLIHALVVKCNQDAVLQVALLEKSDHKDLEGIQAKLAIQVDKSQPTLLEAEFKSWNSSYVAVVAEGRTPELIAVVRALGSARGKVSVGIKVGEARTSTSFDSGKATDINKVLMKSCKLDDLGR